MDSSIQRDAREFGTYINSGGWRLGLLVARSVEPGKGSSPGTNQHSPQENQEPRQSGGDMSDDLAAAIRQAKERRSVPTETDRKVSARMFAHLSGTSPARVMRYYEAWGKAAAAGVVPRAEDLESGTELELSKLPAWGRFYAAPAERAPQAPESRLPLALFVAGLERTAEELPALLLEVTSTTADTENAAEILSRVESIRRVLDWTEMYLAGDDSFEDQLSDVIYG